jgi:hypothetical protein
LRASAGGADSLRATLDSWAAHPEGSKLILTALEAWVVEPQTYRYVGDLPPLVVNDSISEDNGSRFFSQTSRKNIFRLSEKCSTTHDANL